MTKKKRESGVFNPITETSTDILEGRSQKALLKTRALQSAIFSSANFSSIATDEKGVIQIFNVGAERKPGYTAADVMDKITIMLVKAASFVPGTILQINTSTPNLQVGTPTPTGQINVPGFKIQVGLPGLNPLINTADSNGRVTGIWLGIWHGIISPVTLIFSFTNPNIQMYEVHNNGSYYTLGFLIGVVFLFLVLGLIVRRRR